jgi:hypothetical protein
LARFPTPDQVRGRLSLENALSGSKSTARHGRPTAARSRYARPERLLNDPAKYCDLSYGEDAR